jgi:nucleoside-diphosphate-sugar epimerase
MIELATTVLQITNSKSELKFESLPQDDPRQRKPDISRAKEILNWQPSIELNEGITRTVEYFSNLLK